MGRVAFLKAHWLHRTRIGFENVTIGMGLDIEKEEIMKWLLAIAMSIAIVVPSVPCQAEESSIKLGALYNLTGGMSPIDAPASRGSLLAVKLLNTFADGPVQKIITERRGESISADPIVTRIRGSTLGEAHRRLRDDLPDDGRHITDQVILVRCTDVERFVVYFLARCFHAYDERPRDILDVD